MLNTVSIIAVASTLSVVAVAQESQLWAILMENQRSTQELLQQTKTMEYKLDMMLEAVMSQMNEMTGTTVEALHHVAEGLASQQQQQAEQANSVQDLIQFVNSNLQEEATLCHQNPRAPQPCDIDVKDFPTDSTLPLIYNKIAGPDESKIVHPWVELSNKRDRSGNFVPTGKKFLPLNPGQGYGISCPGNVLTKSNTKAGELKCTISGTTSFLTLTAGGSSITVQPADLMCQAAIKSSLATQYVDRVCPQSTTNAVIGWEVDQGVFLPQIDVNFNVQQRTTRFTCHLIDGSSLVGKCPGKRGSNFRPDGFDGVNVDIAYTVISQNNLAAQKNIKQQFSIAGELYFAKGHLSPHAIFIYHAEREASNYYVNAVPQWQKFNNGNWRVVVECGVRQYAQTKSAVLRVWTGSQGVLQLPDQSDQPVNFILGQVLQPPQTVIPAPAYMWKVIHDVTHNTAVVIIGNNDVTNTATDGGSPLITQWCTTTDRCSQLTWFRDQKLDKGHLACCSVDEVIPQLTGLPNLGHLPLMI